MRLFITLLIVALNLTSCKPEFEPISYGHDACAHCKMTIMDKRFAAEIVTKKGRSYKFDDIACLSAYLFEEHLDEKSLIIFVADYTAPDKFIDAIQAQYLRGDAFKSPMGGNTAAIPGFSKELQGMHAQTLKWENLKR